MTSMKMVVWGPRVLGVAVSAFLALFALDAFEEGRPLLESLAGFAIHLLPAMVVLALVVAAWHWEWVGALGFIGLAAFYAIAVGGRLDWVLAISGPLVLVGLFFAFSWWYRRGHGAVGVSH